MTKLKAIPRCFIFDMDGTIFDTSYDWIKIKEELQTGGKPILSYIEGLKEPEKSRKLHVLEKYENEATKTASLKQGMDDYIRFLRKNGILLALVTNNSRKNTDYLLKKHGLNFDYVITRESGLWKPGGAPFLKVMKNFGVNAEECMVVGDSLFDVEAAKKACIRYIFIIGRKPELENISGIIVCSSVKELASKTESLLRGEFPPPLDLLNSMFENRNSKKRKE